MRKPYPTDLTDEQWELVAPLLPPARGRRIVDIREVVNAILYITRSGCQWRMLPHEFPNSRTVHDYHTRWQFNGTWHAITDALRRPVRREQHPDAGEDPATARIDSQSVKSAGQSGEVGIDGGKRVKGRKRHIAVDSLGLLLSVAVTAANVHDARAAPRVLAGMPDSVRDVYADSSDHSSPLKKPMFLAWSDAVAPIAAATASDVPRTHKRPSQPPRTTHSHTPGGKTPPSAP